MASLLQSPADKIYSQEKHTTKAPVIKYLHSEEDTNVSFLSRRKIKVDDELSIRFLNMPSELSPEIKGTEVKESYTVDFEGNISLLLIGRVQVAGLTSIEVHQKLEKAYAHYYRDPQINVRLINQKVFFIGETSQKAFLLQKERTHLIEVLAEAGGIAPTAKPHKIKIIRGSYSNPDIIWVDFTKLSSLDDPTLYMQPGDIIYIQTKTLSAFVREISPLMGIVSIASFSLNLYNLIYLMTKRN